MHRVQKLMSQYGYCSRRKAEELIKAGRVKVNDNAVSIGDSASEDDTISVDNKPIRKDEKVYLMFNKPVGCVTALQDDKYPTVMKYIHITERVFPVGRLDYNTSGLLLLTNDGDFANKVMHPRYEVTKTYLAGVDKKVDDKSISQIEKGVKLEDGITSPANVRKIENTIVEITIHEGKNRIVRRMLKELGFRVRFLERVRIGNLILGDLKPGKYRFLKKKEMNSVFGKGKVCNHIN